MFGEQFREKCEQFTVLKCPDCGVQYQVSWVTFVNMLHVKPYIEIVCVVCGSVVKKVGSKRGGEFFDSGLFETILDSYR